MPPVHDAAKVNSLGCAEELRSRMERKGCTEGPAALAVLSDLLFGRSQYAFCGLPSCVHFLTFPDTMPGQSSSPERLWLATAQGGMNLCYVLETHSHRAFQGYALSGSYTRP